MNRDLMIKLLCAAISDDGRAVADDSGCTSMAQARLEVTANEHPFQIGENYMIETVTKFFTGKLVAVMDKEIVLEDACWVAQTGRYSEAFVTGFAETEPLPEGFEIIGRGSVVSARILKIALPRSVK